MLCEAAEADARFSFDHGGQKQFMKRKMFIIGKKYAISKSKYTIN